MTQPPSLHASSPPSHGRGTSPAKHWSGEWSAYLPLTQTRLVGLASQLTQPFCTASEAFWEEPIHLHFVGILAQAESYFLPGQQVFVARHPLPNHPEVELEVRLSRSGCQWLLASVLGESPADNDETLLSQLTSLETDILHGWCDQLFEQTSSQLPMPAASEPLSPGASTLDFLWMIGQPDPKGRHSAGVPINEEGEFGKLILRMPKSYLRYLLAQPATEVGASLSASALHHALPTVCITVGHTRLTLEDAHHLEAGDVLMLEDSHLETMSVSTGATTSVDATFDARITLSPTVQRAITLPLPPQVLTQFQEEPAMTPTQNPSQHSSSASASSQFWQQVHIDVNATFEPVRIPLLELQQLSEGLIMEVGDLTRNAIHLQVDGKSIASGELVIIGDKFGVRVTRVESDSSSSPADVPVVSDIAPAGHAPESQAATAQASIPMSVAETEPEGMPLAVDSGDEGGMPMAVEGDGNEDGEDDW